VGGWAIACANPCTAWYQAFKKHAAAGYLAASAYPIPEKYVTGIRLPGGIKPKGKSSPKSPVPIITCTKCARLYSAWDAFHDMIVR
jgi:hypothetical protein